MTKLKSPKFFTLAPMVRTLEKINGAMEMKTMVKIIHTSTRIETTLTGVPFVWLKSMCLMGLKPLT